MAAPNPNSEIPWHAAYPSPKSKPASVSRSEVLQWFKSSDKDAPKDFILVDLRRNDHEGGTIAGSINLPAQSLYPSFPSLYALFSAAKVKRVVWYCGLLAPCILMFTVVVAC
jgi:arsenical-resistance protein 2